MRIYAAADIHGRWKKLEKIKDNIRERSCDILVLAGDICGRAAMEGIMSVINEMPVPVLAVRGNVDPGGMITKADEYRNISVLHRRSLEFGGVSFVGVCGAVPVPFRSRIAMRERETAEKLGRLVSGDSVLIAHPPPLGVLDRAFGLFHSGSRTIKTIVEKTQPRLFICGHIHEGRGHSTLGRTVVVNCALGRDGEGSIIDLEKDIITEITMM